MPCSRAVPVALLAPQQPVTACAALLLICLLPACLCLCLHQTGELFVGSVDNLRALAVTIKSVFFCDVDKVPVTHVVNEAAYRMYVTHSPPHRIESAIVCFLNCDAT